MNSSQWLIYPVQMSGLHARISGEHRGLGKTPEASEE